MDNFDYSRNRSNEYMGVNKTGKNIKKSPLHQQNFPSAARQHPQPQVYNINKNDFQSVVQQLTGSPSRHSQDPLHRPPSNPPNPSSMRLQRIRPSPLTPLNINRPRIPVNRVTQNQMPPIRPPNGAVPFSNNLARPPPSMAFGDHTGQSNANTTSSPVSAYMRYLQNSIIDSTQGHPQPHPQGQSQSQQRQSSGLLPYPLVPPLPSPRMNSPSLLPSPASQFLLPSPSGYLNLLSPLSPYPLLSPNFSFSPMAQSGVLGPGPQPPLSPPGMGFPLSPGFFSFSSPRWRD